MFKFIYIGFGGFLGAISRYTISKWIGTKFESTIPYGTLTVNILGSFVLGFLMTFIINKTNVSPNIRLALTTGFLGALTTFSTYAYETIILIEDKNYYLAGFNILSNLLLGLIFVLLGIFLAKAI